MRTLVVGLIGALLVTSTARAALVLCQKKSGAVFVRSACKKKETPLDPVALGLQGPPGNTGAKGDPGPPGPFPTTLPTGQTIRGSYRVGNQTVSGTPVLVFDTESFVYPLTSAPIVNVITIGGASTSQCPGSADNPQAAPGNLCIYAALGLVANPVCVIDPTANLGCARSATTGFTLSTTTNDTFSTGTWAVTAP